MSTKSKSKSLPWDVAVKFSILAFGRFDRFAQETHRKFHPLAKKD